jgi:hypothetical protein
MEGLALLAQIQVTTLGTPGILRTGVWEAALRAEAQRLGAFAGLLTPFAVGWQEIEGWMLRNKQR